MTSPTPQERFGQVRSLLHQPPSGLVWSQLCAVIDDWPPSPHLTYEVLPYTQELLSSWPTSIFRPAPYKWWSISSPLDTTLRSAAMPLANGLSFWGATLDLTKLRALVELCARHRFTHLDLSRSTLGVSGAKALAAMPQLAQLLALYVAKNQLGQEGARALTQSPHLKTLERLDLSENALQLAGLDVILELGAWPALKHLELYGNELGDPGIARLAQQPLSNKLTSLGLGLNRLCYQGHQSLGMLLQSSACVEDVELRHLELRANRLGDVGALMLADSPRLHRLKTLGLRYTFISAQGINALMCSERLTELESLDLGSNTIDPFELQPMRWALPSLKRLSLNRAPLEDQGFIRLLNAAAFDDLEQLNLNETKLTSVSVQALVQRTAMRRLSVLSLNGNPIDDAGALAIARSEHLGSLRRLKLRATQLSPEGVEALKACPQITELIFSD